MATTFQEEASTGQHFFTPGQNFNLQNAWRRPARVVHPRVRVRVPGRLHFQVIDFTRMVPRAAGGGGLGTSTSTAETEIEITIGAGPAEYPVATAEHLVRLFCELVGYEGGDVRVSRPRAIEHVHAGYGSNVTFNTALLAGLNAAFGTPFSIPELYDILTRNFVENADDGRIYWGFDTGLGEACVLYGGVVWVDEGGRYLGSADASGLWLVTATGSFQALANPRLQQIGAASEKGVGEQEEYDVFQICIDYQAEYGERLLHFLEHRMKPHLLRGDARALLAQGWALNELGSPRVLGLIWKGEVLTAMLETVRRSGGLYASMSSAGPTVFALAESEETAGRVARELEAGFSDYLSNFAVGRPGGKLKVFIEPS